jgi:hypothetical protein
MVWSFNYRSRFHRGDDWKVGENDSGFLPLPSMRGVVSPRTYNWEYPPKVGVGCLGLYHLPTANQPGHQCVTFAVLPNIEESALDLYAISHNNALFARWRFEVNETFGVVERFEWLDASEFPMLRRVPPVTFLLVGGQVYPRPPGRLWYRGWVFAAPIAGFALPTTYRFRLFTCLGSGMPLVKSNPTPGELATFGPLPTTMFVPVTDSQKDEMLANVLALGFSSRADIFVDL